MAASLRALSEQFLTAHTHSWRVADGEGDQGPIIYDFNDEASLPGIHPTGQPVESYPARFDALTLRLTPERYRKLALDLFRLLNGAMDEGRAADQPAAGHPCTLAVLTYGGELRGQGKGVSRKTSSFLGLETAPA